MRDFAFPGTKPQYTPDRQFDVQHYAIEVHLDFAKKSITGTTRLELESIVRDARWLRLDAVDMEIKQVRHKGKQLRFEYDNKQLWIDLEKPSFGQVSSIEIDYKTTPRRGLYFIGPDDAYPKKPVQAWTQGQDQDSRHWFPCFDSPNDKATSEVIAHVPKGMKAISNGELVSEELSGSEHRYHYRLDVPHSCYLVTLAVADFAEIIERHGGVEFAYYAAKGQEALCHRALARTPQMMALFADKFGVSYPHKRYAQVFVADFIFGGMENTTATTLTDTVLYDERAALDYDADDLVAHELAHQWFGDLLTCRDWSQGWLNEGFATYSEYIWKEHHQNVDEADLDRTMWLERYFDEDSSRYRRSIVTNEYEEPIDVFDHHLYDKGGLVLHMLRKFLADEHFWLSIQHYLKKHRASFVDTKDLSRAVEESTGRVMDWFFDQWVTKNAGHPELNIDYSYIADKHLVQLVVKQTQKVEGKTPLFRVPTSVRFRVHGKDQDHPLTLTEAQETFFFHVDAAPTHAIFDPGKHLLARIKTNKPTALWQAEMLSATVAVDRISASRALAEDGSEKCVEALAHGLKKDPFWGVQAACATALGKLRSAKAKEHLEEALASTKHPKARRAVAKALGEFRYNEGIADLLSRHLQKGDASIFVEAEAALSLGKLRVKKASELLPSLLSRTSFNEVIRQHVFRGMAETHNVAHFSQLLDGTSYGQHPSARRAATTALASLAAKRQDTLSDKARERCEELLRDPDFRVQMTALEALDTLADPQSVGTLSTLAREALDGRLRRRAKEIIRNISESRSQHEQLTSLRDDLDKLQQSVHQLQAQIAEPKTPLKAPGRAATKAKKRGRKR